MKKITNLYGDIYSYKRGNMLKARRQQDREMYRAKVVLVILMIVSTFILISELFIF